MFCREIFLDKAETADLSFWLAQILKPWPMCFQARILFILYGPTDPETGTVEFYNVTDGGKFYSPLPQIVVLYSVLK